MAAAALAVLACYEVDYEQPYLVSILEMLWVECILATKTVSVQVGNVPGIYIDIIKAVPLIR